MLINNIQLYGLKKLFLFKNKLFVYRYIQLYDYIYIYGPLHMDMPVLADQQKLT